ncbi:bifunctional folylpolyglutamate synthase/dihydrofolate synthase [Sphingobacterium sp. SRCM116780]|uniref:bifunctional folylpolyglutamate synthase/dihydrofolate synthase n=1 Tax=Sphingobacterium sp. SRCM116780 TaxID=2907623 RepID=UPI001F17ED17|nr:folylpolyglutamate synthase/dihydrofolate synthase family protein [Sphingobacterium sp. SRCM116780]UIR56341.1 bifunctional folylpolyglutamate synthase/dihydrofolate synthase [Sphingobacterium sp. SRCM116780]
MNNYKEVIEYLYARLPMFTRDGASAFKKDLDNTLAFLQALGNPQHKFKSIHIAGTNGKGSSSHMLASIFSEAGYKTALYTSPHLLDFRERIRIDGQMVNQQFVIDFVHTHRALIEEIQPSFFEVTVAMAFDFFSKQAVDIAIIEVGLGGRLDSTNVIQPLVSLITNIGFDHMNMLGNTLAEIAFEKAGIIKENTPVVVSEYQLETAPVFIAKANQEHAALVFASESLTATIVASDEDYLVVQVADKDGEAEEYELDLKGTYQSKNILGVLQVVEQMRILGYNLPLPAVKSALKKVQAFTGLQGRWQTLSKQPFVICDTGHNEDGIQVVLENLARTTFTQLHFVIGAMRDKDLGHILPLLPKDAIYYFSNPDMPRAMPAEELAEQGHAFGLVGKAYGLVLKAFEAAQANYQEGDLIFVGGSNFVVSEVLANGLSL